MVTHKQCWDSMRRLESEIAAILPNPLTVHPQLAAAGIKAAAEVLPEWFVPLMKNAFQRFNPKSHPQAWRAFHDNLLAEEGEDHPQLLRDFAKCTDNLPMRGPNASAQLAYARVQIKKVLVPQFESYMNDPDPFSIVSLITALEASSEKPVRWMHEVARDKLSATDEQLKWSEIHGEADKEHSERHVAVFVDMVNERGMQLPENPFDYPAFKTAFDLWHVTLALSE